MTLELRNRIIVCLMQAMLGSLTRNFKMVLLDFSNDIFVEFYLEEDVDADIEEIEEILTEFDSLVMGIEEISIKFKISIGHNVGLFNFWNRVPIYMRKEQA